MELVAQGNSLLTFTFLTGLWSRPVRMPADDDAVQTEVSERLLAYSRQPQEYYLKFGKDILQ